MKDRLQELKDNYENCDFDYKDIEWLFQTIEDHRRQIEMLNDELEAMTEDRNKWRSNSLD